MSTSKSLGLDLDILKRISRDKLIRILEDASGLKDLVIDSNLMKLLDRIADLEVLRSHGVDKIYRLEPTPPPVNNSKLVYLITPSLFNIKYIADHVNTLREVKNIDVHIVCVPTKVCIVDIILEEEGLIGIVTIHVFSPEFISLDNDLLSLEMNSYFRDASQEHDFSGCMGIARALTTIDSLYGPFPVVFGYGRGSQAVLKAFQMIKDTSDSKKTNTQDPEIGHLMIFDRDIDLITPLLTQLTYEGTIDEHFGIKAGATEFPKEVSKTNKPLKIALNCHDTIFDNIRNRHFADVGSRLRKRAKELQDRQSAMKGMTPAQMKDYVSTEFRTIQALKNNLTLHISACEAITKNVRKDFEMQLTIEHGLVTGSENSSSVLPYLSDLMSRQLPSPVVLRLLCLYALTKNGLSQKEYENISSEFFQAYGYQHLVTFQNLRTCGLLTVSGDASEDIYNKSKTQILHDVVSSLGGRTDGTWHKIAKKLNLINTDEKTVDLRSPTDMSYVFNGTYTSVIPQIIMEALTKGYPALLENLKTLPNASLLSCTTSPTNKVAQRVAFVLVVGGITYSEIAALRLLSVVSSTKIIIASTNTVTGTTLVKSAYHQNES